MIATWMSANVFFVIIPNQKKVVADLLAGRSPDPDLGQQAKQRSTHNNYLTLPVIFLMLSNHYPLAWSSRYSVGIVGDDPDRRRADPPLLQRAARGQGIALVDLARRATAWPSQSGCRSSASPATSTRPRRRPP